MNYEHLTREGLIELLKKHDREKEQCAREEYDWAKKLFEQWVREHSPKLYYTTRIVQAAFLSVSFMLIAWAIYFNV